MLRIGEMKSRKLRMIVKYVSKLVVLKEWEGCCGTLQELMLAVH
ncbi:hypothetical protein F4694_003391 [Bacillus niacini]|uniref:Uncharacterized protein n=1 Tax=Neobacillus niacini TaxID=86668 RepID=A0A852TEI2_9BACI|nr:hypothetical protein [Neobacillus niacini]NYE06611.1 hypothetical protein [Neobacillus niacini]